LVVEPGTFEGGSALFFASLFDLIGHGHVVTVDIETREGRPEHERVTYLSGSSTAPEIIEQIQARAVEASRVLIVLDSDHQREHVLAELRAYGDLVTPGSYMIVEDTNVNGHPIAPELDPGPMEAIDVFLGEMTASSSTPHGRSSCSPSIHAAFSVGASRRPPTGTSTSRSPWSATRLEQ
jgi:cephalosporin hydroxylase